MKSGETVRICGWGNTKYPGSSYPSTLKCVDVKYITVSDCNARNKYNGAILKGMFCAGVSGGGKDACQGDSGGPVKKVKSRRHSYCLLIFEFSVKFQKVFNPISY